MRSTAWAAAAPTTGASHSSRGSTIWAAHRTKRPTRSPRTPRGLSASQQTVSERLSLYAALSGQLSNKNLDSSEKFYLGGADGVRAYPENEGGGTEGLLANLEGRVKLPANFNAAAFVDWGSVHINKDNDFPGATTLNTDDLKGAGVSLGWVAPFGLSAKATWARRIGTNPDPTSTGDDQDGSHIENRVWLQVSMPF
jgi:hemolysin activation/secretion protein